jgi:hypothetical protein
LNVDQSRFSKQLILCVTFRLIIVIYRISETAQKYFTAFSILRVATKTYTLPDESLVIEKGQKLICTDVQHTS